MREHKLDICRILACMLVVMIHTVMLFWDFDPNSSVWAVYNFIAVVIRCGVPLFFMISGALLLGREELDIKKHLRRVLHFLLLYFVWSFICAFIDAAFFHVWYQDFDPVELIFGSYYHLWYLPALLLCYLFVPILHSIIHKRPFPAIYTIAVFAITAVLALLFLIPVKPYWLELLTEHFNPVNLRYLLYFLLGWWLYKHSPGGIKLAMLGLVSFAAVLLYAELNRRYSINLGQASTKYYDYLSPAMLLLSSFVFCLCMQAATLPEKLRPALEFLSACTLGIYLVHPLFISALKSLALDFTQFNTFVFFPLCYLSFLCLSLAFTFILRSIPISKQLIK